LSAIIETVDAADTIDEIVRSEAIDALWIGQRDLVDDLARHRPEADADRVVAEILDSFRESGRTWGMGAADYGGLEAALSAGAHRCALYWERYQIRELGNIASNLRSRREV
jgi:2-keto-3-deoxy-L-rhamnonate aldolase RhmA